MKMSSKKYSIRNKWYLLFYLYRIIFASILFFKLIPGLEPADALNFNAGVNSAYTSYSGGISTRIILFLNIWFNVIFGKYISFLVFTSITSYVLVKLCENINYSKRYILLTIFSLPTFTMFSVGLTKEFFIIAFISLFVIYIINKKYKLIFLLLFLLILFVKPQIALIVIFYFIFTSLKKLKNNLLDIRLPVIFLSLIIFFFLVFIFSDQLFIYQKLISSHFSDSSNTTRNIVFFEDKYSYVTKSLEGIYYLVFGPTIFEVINLKQGLVIFLENSYIILLLILKTKRTNYLILSKSKIYIYFSLFFVGFYVLYPAAIYNFVSAIRYRIPILILIIYYFFHLNKTHEKKSPTIH
tara:strand:+ start:1763 stop:2821 length:1059 start_codon:yes stop_codon:yes gene_type:complete